MASVELGVALLPREGHGESGDRHVLVSRADRILLAAIDGIGHGESAAAAAEIAAALLEAHPTRSLADLIHSCHDALRHTRGVVMSLASFLPRQGLLEWLGVGNVQTVLQRAGAARGTIQEVLLLRAGVVGAQLPPLQAATLSVSKGDTLVFATDGIHGEFVSGLSPLEPPQKCADRILQLHSRGNDDALVLVARFPAALL